MPQIDTHSEALTGFLSSLADVPWLSRAGDSDKSAIVARDLVDAWDRWNPEMLAVRNPQTAHLECIALLQIGEDGVNTVFKLVSRETDAPLRAAMERYYESRSHDETNADRGLWPEWLDAMKRDLCWAAVEAVINRPGFFTDILSYYRAGRWPCAWEDGDIQKRPVLL